MAKITDWLKKMILCGDFDTHDKTHPIFERYYEAKILIEVSETSPITLSIWLTDLMGNKTHHIHEFVLPIGGTITIENLRIMHGLTIS